jgi:hypothetical protein
MGDHQLEPLVGLSGLPNPVYWRVVRPAAITQRMQAASKRVVARIAEVFSVVEPGCFEILGE